MSEVVLIWMIVGGILVSGLAVFFMCQYLMKQFLLNMQQQEFLQIQKQRTDHSLPRKLQAYERYALLFERLHVPGLIARYMNSSMSSGELQAALMVAIQKEFEHNVSQQIYISDKLWQVLEASKQEIFNQLDQVMISIAYVEDGETYSRALIDHFSKSQNDPSRKAIFAVKQEARLLIN